MAACPGGCGHRAWRAGVGGRPAKLLSPTIEEVVQDRGLPYGVVGVVIALFVLAPESIALQDVVHLVLLAAFLAVQP